MSDLVLDIPSGNYLRPNGHGGYIIRQSDLSAWWRCNLQKFYEDRAANDPEADQPSALSATEFGSVVHHATMVMEQAIVDGHEDPLALALRTFEHYWDPAHIRELPGVTWPTEWLPRETYGGLGERGRQNLTIHYDIIRLDRSNLLGLEYRFAIPMPIAGRLHTLTGTIDRLSLRAHYNKPYISVDDNKGLWVGTRLPTPTGWTTMGNVAIGDQLLGSDGHPVVVTVKSEIHNRPCYEITFDDKSTIVADNVHLWTATTGEVVSTESMSKRLINGETFRIANAAPLRTPVADLPVDPYVLGVWLGDGNRGRGVVTSGDREIFNLISKRGYQIGKVREDPRSRCLEATVKTLVGDLRRAAVLNDKHVPNAYLRGSWQQRLDLLRGLMDSDGCWSRGRRHAIFINTNPDLATAVHELIVSMGWKARMRSSTGRGFGKDVRHWRVTFTPVDHNPFLLSRKADLVDTLGYSPTERPRRRLVKSVELVPTVATQCIKVDAPDSLFLCGEQMIPTHNTGKQPTYLRWNSQGSGYAWASTIPEFWTGWPESGVGELEVFDAADMKRLHDLFESWQYRLHRGSPEGERLAARRFRWINLKEMKLSDGGWRTERDYARFLLAVEGYIRSCEAEAYSINTTGEICRYCSFRKTCAGVGIDEDELDGAPNRRVNIP